VHHRLSKPFQQFVGDKKVVNPMQFLRFDCLCIASASMEAYICVHCRNRRKSAYMLLHRAHARFSDLGG